MSFASASQISPNMTFNVGIISQVTNDLGAKVEESNSTISKKQFLEKSAESNIQVVSSQILKAKKYPDFGDTNYLNNVSNLVSEWRVNLEKVKGFKSASAPSSLSWTEIFKQSSSKSFQDFSSKPPVLSSDRLRITKIEFPSKPTNKQILFFRVYVTSKYFVSNLLVGANFGGNNTGGGVGFASGSIYPGAPIIINSDGIALTNLIESISFTNDEFQYQILVPLYVTQEANLDQYFNMADFASFIVRDASRLLIACPWWFARNGSPIATNPDDQWVKSQLFASPSNNPECANSLNSRYVLMQDSFESNLLPHTSNGEYELLRSLYSDYSKHEQAYNSIAANLDELILYVSVLQGDLTSQLNVITNLEIFLNEAEAKASAELKAKQEAEAKASAELKAKQEAEAKAKAAALKKTTITCTKGKLVKKVTAVKPVCPKGYKKK